MNEFRKEKNLTLVIFFTILIQGCSESSRPREKVEYTLPIISGCYETLRKMADFFRDSTKDKDYSLVLELHEFDDTLESHMEISGYVKLISYGSWRTLDGGSPSEYLKIQADGIKADCMANNGIEIAIPKDLLALHRSIISKNNVILAKLFEEKLVYYINDGSYNYE